MKLVILEPLGVEQEKLLALAEEKLTDRVEIEAYDTRVTDADWRNGRRMRTLWSFPTFPSGGRSWNAARI